MKRKLIWLIVVVVFAAALFCGVAMAETGGTDGNITWTLDDSGQLTIEGDGDMPDYAPSGNSSNTAPWGTYFQSVVIGNGVTSIGDYAFRYSHLSSVSIGNGVTSIGDHAFECCHGLISLTIPDNITSIGDYAFNSCNELMSLTIPDGVTSIGYRAFFQCSHLMSVSIGNGVASIGDYAFYQCDDLLSVSIGNGVTSIGDCAFFACYDLLSVSIENGVTSIGDYAFGDCKSLTIMTIPDSVTSIGSAAFGNCYSLTSITIPDSVTRIGTGAFSNCSKLEKVFFAVEDEDQEICFGNNIFQYCDPTIFCHMSTAPANQFYGGDYEVVFLADFDIDGIREITLPGDFLLALGDSRALDFSVFPDDGAPVTWTSSDPSVLSVTDGVVTAIAPGTATVTAVYGAGSDSVTIECYTYENITWTLDDSGLLTIEGNGNMPYYGYTRFSNAYTTSAPWGTEITSIVIGDGVTSIRSYAFSGCKNLRSVIIPDSVTSIGNYAFYGCKNLRSVTIPDSVTSIGDYAFVYCENLRSVTIPDSVTSIGNSAFYNCTSLMSVSIGRGIANIGTYTFANCRILRSVTIPDNVTSIGHSAFSGSGLTNIIIPDSVISIGPSAFVYCGLTSITIPDSVTSIEAFTFYSCTSLTSITIPDSVTSIGPSAFYSCTSLTSITIPDSVTSIGHSAFNNCRSLTSITIPDSVTSIEDFTFKSCVELTEIELPANVTSIAVRTFYECSKLQKVVILSKSDSFTANNDSIDKQATIYCYKNTAVDSWFTQRGYNVQYLDNLSLASIREVKMPADFRLPVGHSCKIGIHVFPMYDNPIITWSSSAPRIISVNADGLAEALKPGSAVITARLDGKTYLVRVTAFRAAESFQLNHTEIWQVVQQPLQLKVIDIVPAGAEVNPSWISSDVSRVHVNTNGEVTSLFVGDATITATSETGIVRNCLVHFYRNVGEVAFTSVNQSMTIGQVLQLTATVTIDNVAYQNQYISFTSSDPTIVSVDNMTGIAQALKTGIAIITATTVEGKSAACQIEVRCPGHEFGIVAKRAEQETDGMLYRRACTICGEPASDLEVIHASRSIWLPGALTSIEAEAFLGSELMEQVWIPENVTVIGEKAFADCENLLLVYIPNSVQTIGDNAFRNSEKVVFATRGVNAALSDYEARHGEISVVHMW